MITLSLSLIDLIFLALLVGFFFLLGIGLGLMWAERRVRGGRRGLSQDEQMLLTASASLLAPRDDEMLIFDRVTLALSHLPFLADPVEAEKAQRQAMKVVGETYGLTYEQVLETYLKVWQWKIAEDLKETGR